MAHEQIKLHIVVSMLCLVNYPYYEETCLKDLVIFIILEKPWHDMMSILYS